MSAVMGLLFIAAFAVNLAGAIDIAGSPVTLDSDAATWSSTKGRASYKSDMPQNMQQFVADAFRAIPDSNVKTACDIIVDKITQKFPTSPLIRGGGAVACKWACLMGDFDLTISYTAGTLFTTSYGGNNYIALWRPSCPAYTAALSSGSATGTSKMVAALPGCGPKPNGQPWTASDSQPIFGKLSPEKSNYAKQLAAFALNNFSTYKEQASYIYKELSKKYPRVKPTDNGWHTTAGCGTDWYFHGQTDFEVNTFFSLGENRFFVYRPSTGT